MPSFQADDQPVISVDTKKKELLGNYRNPGTDWRRKGQPRRVNDFENKKLGNPYGVYDLRLSTLLGIRDTVNYVFKRECPLACANERF